MPSLKEKVQGMFLGVAIGDALGMPVEGMTPDEIKNNYPATNGRIVEYIKPTARKWSTGEEEGTTTDDWQLTKAVADGMILSVKKGNSPLNLGTQIISHVDAMKQSTKGWGKTTQEACRALANGASAFNSGLGGNHRGMGNGCAMKITPVAAYTVAQLKSHPDTQMLPIYTFVAQLSLMTHLSLVAVQSALTQLAAASYCLSPFCDFEDGEQFDELQFINLVEENAAGAASLIRDRKGVFSERVELKSTLPERLLKLYNYPYYDVAKCREEFGGGSCFVPDSLPFSYMFFLRNPYTIDCLYDVVSAGGDADTNGSMVGALLGALHGPSIFPKHLIYKLANCEEVLYTASEFREMFC